MKRKKKRAMKQKKKRVTTKEQKTMRFIAILAIANSVMGLLAGIVVMQSAGDGSFLSDIPPLPYMLTTLVFSILRAALGDQDVELR